MTLTIRELTFIRNQLLEEEPDLPKIFGDTSLTEVITQFVEFAILTAINDIRLHGATFTDMTSFDNRVSPETFKELIEEGRIRRGHYNSDDGRLRYYPSYLANFLGAKKIKFVDWAYKAVVTEIMNYIKTAVSMGDD